MNPTANKCTAGLGMSSNCMGRDYGELHSKTARIFKMSGSGIKSKGGYLKGSQESDTINFMLTSNALVFFTFPGSIIWKEEVYCKLEEVWSI